MIQIVYLRAFTVSEHIHTSIHIPVTGKTPLGQPHTHSHGAL